MLPQDSSILEGTSPPNSLSQEIVSKNAAIPRGMRQMSPQRDQLCCLKRRVTERRVQCHTSPSKEIPQVDSVERIRSRQHLSWLLTDSRLHWRLRILPVLCVELLLAEESAAGHWMNHRIQRAVAYDLGNWHQ